MSVLANMTDAAARLGLPLASTIELLAPCNLKCPHCYVTHQKRNRLSLPVLEDLFEQMVDLGTFRVVLTGGEIALRRDLFDIIAAARKRYLSVELLSTGTLWQQPEWDRLAELGIQSVRMSVYGVTACTHDTVTLTDGSFDRTLASARGLIERGIPVEFSCPVMKTNAHEVGDLLELGEAMGASVVVDPHIFASDHNDFSPLQTAASFEQLVAMYSDRRAMKYLRPDTSCGVPDRSDRPCSVGELSTFIQCTADVFPCTNWPVAGGNLLEQRYADIWRKSPVFAHARSITNASLTTCSACGDRGICTPCAGRNLKEHGSLAAPPESLCDATAARATAYCGKSEQRRIPGHRALPIVA